MDQSHQKIYSIEDIETYCRCPLRQKFRLWGAQEVKVDVREAVEHSAASSIASYMQEASRPNASRAKALDKATKAYKANLAHYDKVGVFTGTTYFTQHFNYGMILIKRFDSLINPLFDRPVHGAMNLSCEIGDSVVTGKVSGLIAFNDKSYTERKYGVIIIASTGQNRHTWERVREGFAYSAMRKALTGLKQYPLSLIRVDPHNQTIKIVDTNSEDQATFEALASTAIDGINAWVFPPQPIQSNCSSCPFNRSCKIKYSNSKTDPWNKKIFLSSLGVKNEGSDI